MLFYMYNIELLSSKQHQKTFTLTADSVDLEELATGLQKHISDLLTIFDSFIQLLTHYYSTEYISDDFTEARYSQNGVSFTGKNQQFNFKMIFCLS